jgi:hypothetical protein
MLKRIALTALFVVSAAIVGVSVAKAHSGTIDMAPKAPKGFCPRGVPC